MRLKTNRFGGDGRVLAAESRYTSHQACREEPDPLVYPSSPQIYYSVEILDSLDLGICGSRMVEHDSAFPFIFPSHALPFAIEFPYFITAYIYLSAGQSLATT